MLCKRSPTILRNAKCGLKDSDEHGSMSSGDNGREMSNGKRGKRNALEEKYGACRQTERSDDEHQA